LPSRPDTKTPRHIKTLCLAEGGIKVHTTISDVTELGFDKGTREYGCGGTCRRLLLEHGFDRIETNASSTSLRGFIGYNKTNAEEEDWRKRMLFEKNGQYDYLTAVATDDRCVPYLSVYAPGVHWHARGMYCSPLF